MASTLVDLVKINITSIGTGPLTLGGAAPGYRGRDALIDGKVYSYSIQQGATYEVGRGTYFSGPHQLTRSVLFSSAGGDPVNLQVNAKVAFSALAEDLDIEVTAGELADAVAQSQLAAAQADASATQAEDAAASFAGLGAADGLSLVGTPETNAFDLLYNRRALPMFLGKAKQFARVWAEAFTMSADLSEMRGFAASANTTGGRGLQTKTYTNGLGNLSIGQTAFNVTWAFDNLSELKVYKNGTLLAASAYTVSGGSGSTGTVTLTAAVIITDQIVVTGYLPTYKVWSRTDDVNTEGSLRWAVAKAKASGGGRILGDPRGNVTHMLKSQIVIDFDNVTIDFPGRNHRIGALNTVQMFRVYGKNVIIDRISFFRPPHYTIADNQFIEYSVANGNASSGQTTLSIPFPFNGAGDISVTKNTYIDLTQGTDYTVDAVAKTITLASSISTNTIRIFGDLYNQGCIWIRAESADAVWINECTFTHHQTYAVNVQYAYLDVGVAATALRVGSRYKIKTLGTTNWNTVGGTSGVTYAVGDILTCAVVGTGTGTADSAPVRATITRCQFRDMSAGMSLGSGILAQTTLPAWATDDATILAQTRAIFVTMDRNFAIGVGRRMPNVNALAYVHKINDVHIVDGYRADDGTITNPYAANVLNGGHLLAEGVLLMPGAPYPGAEGMYATTTTWDTTTRQAQGALKAVGCVTFGGLPIVQANTGLVAAPPYSATVATVPTDLAGATAYMWQRYAESGAEVSPLSEMNYIFVDKVTGDAAGLYVDGINVILLDGGYGVRMRQDIPASGTDLPDILSVASLTSKSVYMPRGSTIIIASDAITIGASGYIAIDTESAASTDDLVTLSGGIDGMIVALRIGVNGRTVRVRNTGNIAVTGDTWLTATGQTLVLIYDGTLSKWVVLASPSFSIPGSVTVSQLPAAAYAGRRAFVTDANSTTFNATAVGGGSNAVPVFDNGSAWKIG